MAQAAMIEISGLGKSFTLHNQGGTVIPVMEDACLSVQARERVAQVCGREVGLARFTPGRAA